MRWSVVAVSVLLLDAGCGGDESRIEGVEQAVNELTRRVERVEKQELESPGSLKESVGRLTKRVACLEQQQSEHAALRQSIEKLAKRLERLEGEPAQINVRRAVEALNEGNVYFESGEFDKAIGRYTEAIQLDAPKAAEAYERRAKSYMQTGEFSNAIDDFGKFIELVPGAGKAHASRGMAYLVMGKPGRAVADLTKAIPLVRENVDSCYIARSCAYLAQKEYDKAIADSTEAIGLDPLNEEAYYYRGLAYGNKGDFDRAIADFSETIQLSPKHAGAYCNRALAYIKGAGVIRFGSLYGFNDLGEVPKEEVEERVIKDLTRAVRLRPGDAKAYALRGTVFWTTTVLDRHGSRDRKQSHEDLAKAAQLDSKYKDGWELNGVVESQFE